MDEVCVACAKKPVTFFMHHPFRTRQDIAFERFERLLTWKTGLDVHTTRLFGQGDLMGRGWGYKHAKGGWVGTHSRANVKSPWILALSVTSTSRLRSNLSLRVSLPPPPPPCCCCWPPAIPPKAPVAPPTRPFAVSPTLPTGSMSCAPPRPPRGPPSPPRRPPPCLPSFCLVFWPRRRGGGASSSE